MSSSAKSSRARSFAQAAAAALIMMGSARLVWQSADASEAATAIPPPAADAPASTGGLQKVVVAGGCFWGVQGVFQHLEGVSSAVSGYAGGPPSEANYTAVSTGRTGHAESVEITYDPKIVSFGKIMQVFFSVAHDPTELNRQGPDSGTQYRSEIFTTNSAQMESAKAYVAQLDKAAVFPEKIVTKIEPLKTFSPAEAYHQDYLTLHPDSGYIARFDLPKIGNLKRMFPDIYRANPRLTSAKTDSASGTD